MAAGARRAAGAVRALFAVRAARESPRPPRRAFSEAAGSAAWPPQARGVANRARGAVALDREAALVANKLLRRAAREEDRLRARLRAKEIEEEAIEAARPLSKRKQRQLDAARLEVPDIASVDGGPRDFGFVDFYLRNLPPRSVPADALRMLQEDRVSEAIAKYAPASATASERLSFFSALASQMRRVDASLMSGATLLKEMEARGDTPPLEIFNSLLYAAVRAGDYAAADSLVERLLAHKLVPNDLTLVLAAARGVFEGDMPHILGVMKRMAKVGRGMHSQEYRQLLLGLAANGHPTAAAKMVRLMETRGVAFTVSHFNAFMLAWANAGSVDMVRSVMADMRDSGFAPDARSFALLIRAHSLGAGDGSAASSSSSSSASSASSAQPAPLRAAAAAEAVVAVEMPSFGVAPDRSVYVALMQLYEEHLLADRAEALLADLRARVPELLPSEGGERVLATFVDVMRGAHRYQRALDVAFEIHPRPRAAPALLHSLVEAEFALHAEERDAAAAQPTAAAAARLWRLYEHFGARIFASTARHLRAELKARGARDKAAAIGGTYAPETRRGASGDAA